MTRQWSEVPTDVLAHYVPTVLAPDGRYARIRELVTSVGYLAEKLTRVGVGAVLDDLRTARRLAVPPQAADELAPIEVALTEAEHILRDQPDQLRGQLLARVAPSGAADVARMLGEASGWRVGTWWRPAGTIHNHGYLATFAPVLGFVDAVAMSDDASLLLAGDRDGQLYAWDLRSRELVRQESSGSPVNAVAFRPDSFEAFVGLDDGRVGRWSPADGRLRIGHQTGRYAVTSLAVDAGVLVFGAGPALHASTAESGRPHWQADTGQDQVNAVAITGECCVSGGRDGSLVVWRLSDGRELQRLPAMVDRVLCLAAVPGTDTVVVGGKDKRVVMVDVGTGSVLALGRHSNQVRSLTALDANRVVSGSYDGQVLVWDLAARTSSRIGRHNGWCLAVAAPRGGGPVAAGSDDGRLRLWDPDAPLTTDLGRPVRKVIVVDGIAYGGTDRVVLRADVDTGLALPKLKGHRRLVGALVETPTAVASGSSDSTIRLWGLGSNEASVLTGHQRGIEALAVTPDGSELVSVSLDGTWRRWDATTGSAGPVTDGRAAYTSVLALSPDGELVVTAAMDHIIEVWNRRSGQLALPLLTGHTGYVQGLAITPDGKTLVSGSWDRTIRFWSLADGELLQTLSCDQWIVDVTSTADGRLVAAYCADGTVILADPTTRTVQSTLDLGSRSYGELTLSSDDRTLFVLHTYELQAWDIDTAKRLAVFDADLPLRCLATAGPDMVVIGTDIGSLVPMRLVSPSHQMLLHGQREGAGG
ncbi:WD40 repeat domain-containing protein [Micromonospora sp. NIE79]|uniref:WD40 repeat domain-containing protein n=1 Tax=Micromonospora trifolii TaxID=2911208 RepID=A0ABS9N868_9ACTN|nr:WD40 repeat domain-containing protein [Micromonospora trifolii]MCG5446162.1 WD40 repeat domain-containing protein [Micromonospora trifolii]